MDTEEYKLHTNSSLKERLADWRQWHDIRELAKSNIALQRAIERVIIIYKLSKPDE